MSESSRSEMEAALAAKDAEIERLRERADEAESRLASCTDLANSWARETGIPEAADEGGLKDLIDRLWAAWSSQFFGQQANYEEALGEGREEVASLKRELSEAQAFAVRVEETLNSLESAYGQSVWATGAGWVLKSLRSDAARSEGGNTDKGRA